MGRRPQTIERCIEQLCAYLKDEEYATYATIVHYESQISCVFKILKERNPDIMPYNVSKDDAKWLYKTMLERKYAISTISSYRYALKKICRFYGNSAADDAKINLPSNTRPNVDWLSESQVAKLLSVPKTPLQELVIHLELFMGLRRIEVIRLELSHIHYPSDEHNGYLYVLGKGHIGGKPRIVPFHCDTVRVINQYLEYRNSLIQKAKTLESDAFVPDNLLIWYKMGELNTYSQRKSTGIDCIINTVAKNAELKFSNHTLRRTFGRMMLTSGAADRKTIKDLLGHENQEETDRYLGVIFKEMENAMGMSPFRSEFMR